MLKSRASGLGISVTSVQFQRSVAQWVRSVAQLRLAPLSLLTVLSFTGISWLSLSALAPQVADAYTARVNVALNREPRESYRSFLRRAEAVARAAAQRSFDRDILVTDVAVTIVGENNGAIAPILALEVSRQAWRRRPDPQRWATYFPNTQSLLGFGSTTEETDATQATPTPNPTATPSGNTPGRVIELPGGVRLIPNPGGTPQQNGAPNQGNPGTPANGANQQNPGNTGTPANGANQQNPGNTGTPANGANQQNPGSPPITAPPLNQGTGTQQNNVPQQNGAPNQPTPNDVSPSGAAPGQVIQLPGGVRLIPNPVNRTNQ